MTTRVTDMFWHLHIRVLGREVRRMHWVNRQNYRKLVISWKKKNNEVFIALSFRFSVIIFVKKTHCTYISKLL